MQHSRWLSGATVLAFAIGGAASAQTSINTCVDHTWAEIGSWMNDLTASTGAPGTAQVSKGTCGTSYEGRIVECLKITGGTPGPKPAILITGANYAREWAGVALVLNLGEDLVTQYNSANPSIVALLNTVEILLVPVLNPDGYAFTWSDDRVWLKNRFDNTPSICKGVNLDRNWDWCWGGPGSSPLPCSAIYHGSVAFSEVETQNLRAYILNHGNIAGVIDCRSGGDVFGTTIYDGAIAYPYGDDACATVDPCLDVIATTAATNWGTPDFVGTLDDYLTYLMFPPPFDKASGTMIDWCHGVLGIPSFQLYLKDTATTVDRCAEYANNKNTVLALIDGIVDNCAPPTCPPLVSPAINNYMIVGPGTGIAWSWCITSNATPKAFADASGTVSGVVGNGFDVATAFASSINAYAAANGCTGIVNSAATDVLGNGFLAIYMGGDTNITLEVGPAGTPCGDPAMCAVNPSDVPCSFNPSIEQVDTSGTDCNGNGIDDAVDIEFGAGSDLNGNGVLDECECPDLDGDETVGVTDLLALLAAWGPCPGCAEDFDGDGSVAVTDLLALLAAWGDCS